MRMMVVLAALIGLLLTGCTDSSAETSKLTETKDMLVKRIKTYEQAPITVQYKGQLEVTIVNPNIPNMLADQINIADSTSDSIGEVLYTFKIGGDVFQIHERGIDANRIAYLIEDVAALRYWAGRSFAQMKDVKFPAEVQATLQLSDVGVQEVVSDTAVKTLFRDLRASDSLADPPLIFGIPYPHVSVQIQDMYTLIWMSPEYVSVSMSSGAHAGWIKLNSDLWWQWLQEQHGESFERSGMFNKQHISFEMPDKSIVEMTSQNRLDEIWRQLSYYIKNGLPTTLEEHPTKEENRIQITDQQGTFSIEVWSNGLIVKGNQYVWDERAYEFLYSYLTAN